MKLFFLIFIVITSVSLAQTDWERWEKKEISFIPHDEEKSSLDNSLINLFYKSYKFFISDLDGDNCAFEPSCSAFFVEAIRSTNILEGSLLFADRFTRDLNFIKMNNYEFKEGKFLDHIDNYLFENNRKKSKSP